jgi:VTC domain-containing protein
MREFTYYEQKYAVSSQDLPDVRAMFESLYGGTDPFGEGFVDSAYYDGIDAQAYLECEEGEGNKAKLRVRRYNEAEPYTQLQLKKKHLNAVAKYKVRIAPVPAERLDHADFQPAGPDPTLHEINSLAAQMGPMAPFVRITYRRARYRVFDTRVTLDYHVEAYALSGFHEAGLSHVRVPFHVLEIKSPSERPMLPLFGLRKLRPASYSKFHLGSRLLQGMGI